MPLQNFVDQVGPRVSAAWLNVVDKIKFTIFADAATKAAARAALTSDAPWDVGQGGTGGTNATTAAASLGMPLLAAANTFTGANAIQATEPRLKFNETDVTADGRLWDFDLNGNVFQLRALNDAESTIRSAIKVTRTTGSAVVTEVALGNTTDGTTAKVNGKLSVVGVTGSHSAQVADSALGLFNVGYLEVPIVSKSASYGCGLSDASKCIYYTGGAGSTITIPANSSVPYPVGTILMFRNDGTASLSIAITTDALVMSPTGSTGTRTLAQYGQAAAHKVTATRWWISGIGLT